MWHHESFHWTESKEWCKVDLVFEYHCIMVLAISILPSTIYQKVTQICDLDLVIYVTEMLGYIKTNYSTS